MDFYEKSRSTLELPAVLNMLAAEAVSDGAKEMALALAPAGSIFELRAALRETSDAKRLIAVGGNPPFYGIKNISGPLARADMGGMLNTRELLDIAAVLRAARAAKGYSSAGAASLANRFAALNTNRQLEDRITNSITGEDEISDSASPELASIRRKMRIAGARVKEALQKIITSPGYSKALQEPIITMRSDRYVVPIKAEYRNSVPGLVHDISASGATLFVEPMQAVQANNEIRELQAKEKTEIERILMELSADAAGWRQELLHDYELLVELDTIFAKARLSYQMNASEAELSEDGALVLRRARHPLLPKQSAVPIDVVLGADYDTLVITGPNTGGKTVSIKTIGLLSLMTLCGLHIPADDGSRIPFFGKIMADIGDEQSIEQSLSTFSSHMRNTVLILQEAGPDTLLLFDELGAGTDPVEGAALAIAIIEYARKLGARIAATTHYAELKVYATTAVGVMNASCEFNVETLRPTYRLITGIPGKSNAFAISERLGLPKLIIEDAEKRIDSGAADFEEVLTKLETRRQEMEKEQEETRRLLQRAREDAKKAEEYRQTTESAREKAAKIARREADKIIEDARRSTDAVFEELKRIRKEADKAVDWQQANNDRAELRRKLNEAQEKIGEREQDAPPPPSSRPVRAGDTVEIVSMGARAEVIAVSPDRVLTLQAGIMKITAREDEVRLCEGETQKSVKKVLAASTARIRAAVSPEIDLRGMMSDEAVAVVEKYIDDASMAKLESVRIIHGKGTGALRAAVQQSLKRNKLVKSFRLGTFGEGEAGVTVAELK